LHDVLTAKKSRTWVKVLEQIMMKYIDIAVSLKLHRHAKDGLHQYRNISQQQAPQSLEAIIQHLLKAGESRVAKAAKEAQAKNLSKGANVADLECEQTPEAIMLSTMTDEGDGDRSEREVLVPWLKFLWETYRSVLDILKTNSKLEKVYHQTAARAFEFCRVHERKTEMRRLCETLRHHLSNLQRATAQGNTNRLRGWEGWTQEGIELHLATRFAQLEAASAQELWTEGFRTVEDIHQVMRLSKRPPKAKLMAKYYERLTKIFWVSGNYLFHAYAWWRHAQLTKESEKKPPPLEEQTRRACAVLLSALAIPDASDGAGDAQGLGSTGEADDVDAEKMARMATLLGFRGHPTRAALLAEIAADDELVDVFGHDLPPHVRALHEALENTFAPRKLASTVAPLLKELAASTPKLAHYAEPLAKVAVSRVVAQLGRVYSVVTLDNFEQLVAPLQVPADDVEKLIVGAAGGPGGGASSGGALARVDHRLGVLRFPDEAVQAPASRHLGNLARYVAEAAEAARDHKPEEMRDPDRVAKRARIFEMARAASARDHESALERKQVIERRKEEQERLQQEKKAAEDAEERRLEAVRKEEEESRLARDAKNREREKIEKMRAEIQVQEAKAQMRALGQDVGDEIVNMKEDERQKLIQDQRDKAMQKEIDGARKSLEQARRLDYITRALRLEELPVLEARYTKHLEEDRARHDQQYLEAVAKGKVDHAAALLEKQRLARVQSHREKWEAQVLAARKQQYVTDRADAEAKFKQDAIARKVSRARRRAEDHADEVDRKAREDEEMAYEAAASALRAEEEAKYEAEQAERRQIDEEARQEDEARRTAEIAQHRAEAERLRAERGAEADAAGAADRERRAQVDGDAKWGRGGGGDAPPRRGFGGDDAPRRGGFGGDYGPRRGGFGGGDARGSGDVRRGGFGDDGPPRRGGFEDGRPQRVRMDDAPPRRGGMDDAPRRGGFEDGRPQRDNRYDNSGPPPRRGGFEDGRPPPRRAPAGGEGEPSDGGGMWKRGGAAQPAAPRREAPRQESKPKGRTDGEADGKDNWRRGGN